MNQQPASEDRLEILRVCAMVDRQHGAILQPLLRVHEAGNRVWAHGGMCELHVLGAHVETIAELAAEGLPLLLEELMAEVVEGRTRHVLLRALPALPALPPRHRTYSHPSWRRCARPARRPTTSASNGGAHGAG